MFRDAYKSAHKEITPDEALLQSILDMAEKESSRKNKGKTIRFYPYVSAAAAVFLIAVSTAIYLNLSPNQTGNESSSNIIVENIQGKEKSTDIVDSSLKPDSALKEENKQENIDSPQVFSKKAPENAYNKNTNSSVEYKSEKKAETEKTEESIPEIKKEESIRVMMNINNISSSVDSISRSGGVALADFDAEEKESLFEYWSANEYSTYTGFDIKNDISVPGDMELIENEDFLIEKNPETEEIISDENSYYFEKDYQRFIIVSTSKNKEEAESFLDETKYQITDINGNNATITFDGSLYNAYLIKADLAIKLTAGGISEEELEKTIISITERN